jgi:hypothetical protein
MSGRALHCAVFLGLPLLVIAPGSPARAAENRTGAATQSGWWNRLQGPVDGEPEGNPVRPLVPAVPASATVPSNAIAVSAGGGQSDKVAAVGIDPAVAVGASVDTVSLRLVESAAGGANMSSDKAKVVACPATSPWGPSKNAAWRDRPAADCGLAAVDGVRSSDGVWAFDLTPIVRLWTDPARPLTDNGVVLAIDTTSSPGVVQVSWNDVETGTVRVDVTATPVPAAPATAPGGAGAGPAAAPSAAPPPAVAAGPPLSAVITPAAAPFEPPVFGGGEAAAGPSGDVAVAAANADPAAGAAAGPAAPESNGALVAARPAVGFWEHVPAPSALLVPVAAGLAVLVSLLLGPLGRPSPVFRREGGLSRALARRAAGDGRPGLGSPAVRG